MNIVLKIIESAYEEVFQLFARPAIRVPDQLRRFHEIKDKYGALLRAIPARRDAPSGGTPEYDWMELSHEIGSLLSSGVPLGFLGVGKISNTMVFYRNRGRDVTRPRVHRVLAAFGPEISLKILREDIIGLPKITDIRFRTSANRAHHAYHLAVYTRLTDRLFWEVDTIVEWGGGYGDMARIVRKIRPEVTYVIMDLPELLALQYIYLYSVEGSGSVHIVGEDGMIEKGKVNLLDSAHACCGKPQIRCDAFLSTWAVTESPLPTQSTVVGEKFFGAEKILIAYNRNDGNIVPSVLGEFGLSEHGDDLLGTDHRYACR